MRTAAEQRLRLWTWPAPTAEEGQAMACVGNRTKLHTRAGSCAAGICLKQPQDQRAANTGAVPRSPSITEQRSGAAWAGGAQGVLGGSRGLQGLPLAQHSGDFLTRPCSGTRPIQLCRPFIKHSPCPPSTQQGCGDLPTAWKRCHPSDRQPGVCVPTATPLLPSTFSDIGEAMI